MKNKFNLSACTLVLFLTFQVQAFQFKDATGELHKLEDYKGRWVLINFWATWCAPCLKEIPDLISLYQDRKDIMIIGVAMDYSDPQEIMSFVRSLSINYPIVLGDRKIASQLDEISLLPSTYFYDPDGHPAARQLGIISRENIEKFIESKSMEKK
ncbi:TlpA family protein disulfide reductase [Nitrosomonas ureae]|uniref:Thiol-disulfide isomerase or thioredoxin n=1 Tax=Nitrosomonas ureae TaxID=44577 RepID=A0A1H9DBR5_9PROT|nr:TlpA disulfide reductase family protein [Nitrosomonas ureae]PTQ82645.1 thiol-disulfide isomerase/thioredoxin [Nitrosomonas ureae]PXX17215.1 thiol-disulfide isomerase/thioredoxin [Nitrosomonas ureae]SEQ10914.1 Thiol-disulfide isomerase or thioredoxin [Nitrosomonas ureae]